MRTSRYFHIPFAFVLALLYAHIDYAQSSPPVQSAHEQMRKASLSIVNITGKDTKGRDTEPGRGFFVAHDVIATDYLVIKDAIKIYVTCADKRKKEAQLLGVDALRMLAILKLQESKVEPLTVSATEQLVAGSRIFISDTSGWNERQVINATSTDNRHLIEVGANISREFRGSPLLNERGEVVAIIVSDHGSKKNNVFAAHASHLIPLGEISVEGGFLREKAKAKAASANGATENETTVRYSASASANDDGATGVRVVRKPSNLIYSSAIRRVVPLYPPKARKSHIVGLATVEMLIDEGGDVLWVRAVSGHEFFKEAATAAARGWKFPPSTARGRPVRIIGLLTFNFTS